MNAKCKFLLILVTI